MTQLASTKVLRTFPIVLVLAAACGEAPTAPVVSCALEHVGPALAMSPPSAAALQPLLDDARTRLIPSLSSASTGLIPNLSAGIAGLQTELGSVSSATACQAFNAVAATLIDVSATAPAADTPDLDALRLALRIVRVHLAAQ